MAWRISCVRLLYLTRHSTAHRYIIPALAGFFRARHGSKNQCMSRSTSRERNAKATARREFALFRAVHLIQTELGSCWVARLPCPNHSGRQLKPTGWVLNFGTINCSSTIVADTTSTQAPVLVGILACFEESGQRRPRPAG